MADTIVMFDAATAEEARRRRAGEMGERWRAEWECLRMERELHHRQFEQLKFQHRAVLGDEHFRQANDVRLR
jgi:hypothetical protein